MNAFVACESEVRKCAATLKHNPKLTTHTPHMNDDEVDETLNQISDLRAQLATLPPLSAAERRALGLDSPPAARAAEPADAPARAATLRGSAVSGESLESAFAAATRGLRAQLAAAARRESALHTAVRYSLRLLLLLLL